MKYVCDLCGYVYDEALGDPENGIAAWERISFPGNNGLAAGE